MAIDTALSPTGPGLRPARQRRAAAPGRMTMAPTLSLGVGLIWFSLLVLIPLAAVIVKASGGGFSEFWAAVHDDQTFSAIKLTLLASAAVTALNAVMGTVIAWVLVRDRFWGKGLLDLIIDIPFAMPTIVAGLVLLALYGGGGPIGLSWNNTSKAVYLAIAFVTLPFVVRTVQPVLEELDTDVEDAAASLGASRAATFRRVVLPSLIPAITAGAALSFARGISEYGSMVLLTGNIPFHTQVVSYRLASLIEGDDEVGAAAVATVLLVVALLAIVILDLTQRRLARRG